MHVEYCQDIYGISAIVDNSEQSLIDCRILLPSVFCLLAPGCLLHGLHMDWFQAALGDKFKILQQRYRQKQPIK